MTDQSIVWGPYHTGFSFLFNRPQVLESIIHACLTAPLNEKIGVCFEFLLMFLIFNCRHGLGHCVCNVKCGCCIPLIS